MPRLWTPPLRELTPDTSFGFDLIDFAVAIGMPLDPWQQWVAIHLGELLPGGRPRFRTVLILVARQNGKTLLAKVLTLYWLHIERARLVLGLSASRDAAKETWREVCELAVGEKALPALGGEYGPDALRLTIGEEALITLDGARYRFAANNRRAGRSRTVHRLILDELREHQDWVAWDAATNAMQAVREGQAVAITNQGDVSSVVLDSLRDSALEYIDTGVGDRRLGLFEWSAPNGADPTDVHALAMANPDLGNRIDVDALIGVAMRAKSNGGIELAGFRTEVMCQRVTNIDQAVDEQAWKDNGVDPAGALDLALHRDRVALCFDVALDGSHATLVAAALVDDLVHVEVVRAWAGVGCTRLLRAELSDIVWHLRPAAVGWFPNGPAAAVAGSVKPRGKKRTWAPKRTVIEELVAETPAVCMGLAELVLTGQVQHPRDAMLTQHVTQAQKLRRGDAWVFTRRGTSTIDGTYALAGAVHLARTLPPPKPPLTVA